MNRTTALLAAAAAALASQPAAAITDNFCRVTIYPSFSGGSGPYDNYVTQPGTINLQGSATGGANSSGSATSHVEYGSVVVNAVFDVSGNATGTGYIRDVLTVTAPGVPAGTPGTLAYTIHASGGLSAPSGSSAASWGFQSALGTLSFNMSPQGRFNSPDLSSPGYQGDPLGDFTATISFQYGSPLQLIVQCSANAGASNSFTSLGHATVTDFHFDWRGISNVTANGSPISNFTIVSQTGTQYGGPLPPPCGSADFNCDGDVGTDADIESFFACLSGTCPPPPCTSNADFNGDGDVGTDADIEAFFRVLGGGTC
jgi:hypothetical protein